VTAALKLPEGIDSVENRALLGLLDRWDALPVENVLVFHLDTVIADALPFVAELMGLTAPEFGGAGAPREVIKQAVHLRKLRGTPWALREVMRRLGYGEIDLQEAQTKTYNGELHYDGEHRYGAENHWARFAVYVTVLAPMVAADVRKLWDAIDKWKPKRSWFSLGLRQAMTPTVMYWTRP
jgi:P2-related tail formation protein